MVIAFHESYLYLIELCALFCILIIVYNIFDQLTVGIREKIQIKRTEKIKKIILRFDNTKKYNNSFLIGNLSFILRKPIGLLALLNALDELGWDNSDNMEPNARRALCSILVDKYDGRYKKEDEAVQSLLISLLSRCDASSSRLKFILLNNLKTKNLLVRIETLRCISSLRDRKLSYQSLKVINNEPQQFSNKLLVDTFMEFKGNLKLLLDEVWEKRNEFSDDIKIAIVQMISVLKDDNFSKNVYLLMNDESVDKELRIASIKYFKEVHHPEYVKRIAEFIDDPIWEYGAVAASVLNKYDCRTVFNKLLKGCSSTNWYVRNNCAKTIVECCNKDQIKQAILVDDKYSRDSILYVLKHNIEAQRH